MGFKGQNRVLLWNESNRGTLWIPEVGKRGYLKSQDISEEDKESKKEIVEIQPEVTGIWFKKIVVALKKK